MWNLALIGLHLQKSCNKRIADSIIEFYFILLALGVFILSKSTNKFAFNGKLIFFIPSPSLLNKTPQCPFLTIQVKTISLYIQTTHSQIHYEALENRYKHFIKQISRTANKISNSNKRRNCIDDQLTALTSTSRIVPFKSRDNLRASVWTTTISQWLKSTGAQ